MHAMAIPPLPPAHDSVRLIRETLDETCAVLLEHLRRKPNPWSYQRARSLAPFALSGEVPIAALKHACDTAPMIPAGRAATWDVVQLVSLAGAGRTLQCYGITDGSVNIRKDLSVRVAADFYLVENGRATVFWLQPRRGFALTDRQLGIFGTLLRMALLKGDFVDAGIEIVDLSAPPRQSRQVRKLGLGDLPEIPEPEVVQGLQRVADAYDAIKRMDIDWEALRRKAKPKERKGREDDLFGG